MNPAGAHAGMPTVSVIINTRNGEVDLRAALESLMAQTFTDWEAIIWDDGSTDGTTRIADEYTDPRIRHFRRAESAGLGPARQSAIAHATGEWLAFLDQDDVWTADKLERQIALAGDERVGIIYGRAVRLRGERIGPDADHVHEHAPLPEGRIFERLLTRSCFITMSAAMLRRAAVEALGPLPDDIVTAPDYHWFLGVSRTNIARAVQDVVCLYRVHRGSMTTVHAERLHGEIIRLVERWGVDLPPRQIERRRRVHETLIGLSRATRGRGPASEIASGLAHIVRRGSVVYLMQRPFVRAARSARRAVVTPRWRRDEHITNDGAHTDAVPRVAGVRVSEHSPDQAVRSLARCVEARRPAVLSAVNAYGIALAHRNPAYKAMLNCATMQTPDGMPVVWMLRLTGHPSAQRVHNDDLLLECCARFPGWRIALVGGRESQPQAVAAALRERFPGVRVVAECPTPVRPVPRAQTEAILRTLRDASPDVIWLGMGTPAQDEWAASVRGGLPAPAVGCGSLFDLLSGRTRPTPRWMKSAGLQWLHRLGQEPRRLFTRYASSNTRFLALAARQLLGPRREPASTPEFPRVALDRAAPRPDLSVVIVTYNAKSLIDDCLTSLRTACEGLTAEVFVVDSASRDGTARHVREHHPHVHVIESPHNLGFSAGNNAALPKCRGRFVALLNPDTIVEPDAMRRLISELEANPHLGAVGPRLILADGSTQLEVARPLPTLANIWPWLALIDKLHHAVRDRGARTPCDAPPPRPRLLDGYYLLGWERDRTCDIPCLSGACMVIRGEAARHVGPLDEASPMYLDDIDYCKRLGDAGWTLRYVHEARVTHLWGASTAPLRRQGDFYALVCHALYLYFRKHRGRAAAAAYALLALAAAVFRAPVCLAMSRLAKEPARAEWRRRLALTAGLFRWAARLRKRAPRFGFKYEADEAAASAAKRRAGPSPAHGKAGVEPSIKANTEATTETQRP